MNGAIAQPVSLALAEWRLKVRLSAVLVPFFCVPYFLLQRLPLAPVWRPAPGRLEEAIGFHPEWVWAYQSAYVLLALVPWLAASGARDLHRYARGFVLLSSIGFICFLLVPIECPRPSDAPGAGMYGLLVTYDRPLNTFPSLHVGLSVYTVLFGARVLRGRMPPVRRRALLALLGLWICAIAWAAVAIRQHFVADVPAGAALAWICHRWAWRPGAHAADRPGVRLATRSPARIPRGSGAERPVRTGIQTEESHPC